MSRPLPPGDPFKPFVPSEAEPWDTRRAAHLYRRTALGGSWDQLQEAVKAGHSKAIDKLFGYDVKQDQFNELLDKVEGLFDVRDVRRTQEWWFYRIVNTDRPMQERMALFWHNYFATSASKVGNGEVMNGQIELFRQMGLGNFRELLLEVGRDAAMLIWLDGRTSQKGTPNENYAREVMELFTLGPGNYTEQDIRELSRAFTGWVQRGTRGEFEPKRFDDGEKSVLGKTAAFDDEQAVDLLLSQDAAPKYLANRFLMEFVHPEPEPEHVDHFAKRLKETKWDLKTVLKEMVGSRLFFSDYAYRSRIKSPVELVVGGVRSVDGKAKVAWMRDEVSRMGQDVLFPPNVGGWDGDRAWINGNSMLTRFNFGLKVGLQLGGEFTTRTKWIETLKPLNLKTGQDVVDHFCQRLIGEPLAETHRTKLVEYLCVDEKGKPREFKLDGYFEGQKVRDLIHMILTSPQAQMA